MRLAIFAIVLTGADALSLRGHPSLLQAKLPLPQNSMAKEQEKTLGDMEATLMRMAKSGHVGTPMKDFADLIMPHLTSMEGAINASHTTDQTTMDSYGAAFTTCTEAKTTADGEASTLLVTKGTQSTAHKNCRTSEGMAQTNYTNCVTAMNSLETSKKTACDAYILANKAPDVNLVPQPGMGASYRSWLVSVKDWVINELANLDAAHESCVNASILYDNKKLECEGANGQGGLWLVHDSLKTQCNANQTALEGTTCSYASAVESACSGYSTCYTNANTSYFAGKANLLSAQSNRILEYQLVKRLMCFCNLFSAANGADLASADIDTCKNTNEYQPQHTTFAVDASNSSRRTPGMSCCCPAAMHYQLHVHRIWVSAQQRTGCSLQYLPLGNNNHDYNNTGRAGWSVARRGSRRQAWGRRYRQPFQQWLVA